MSENRNITVGFIGLGIMGAPMSANLVKAGYRVVVNDIRREAAADLENSGAIWAATPRETAAQCDVVMTCLPTVKAIETVALGQDGIIEGAHPGLAYFEMSTNAMQTAKQLNAAFAERGVQMLEAPISGGGPGAAKGQLAIWVGGDRATYDRFEGVLRAMGDQTRYIGAFGAGLVTKMTHNCISGSINAVLAEVFTMAIKAGAEPLALWEAVRQGVLGRRRTFDGMGQNFLPGIYEPTNAATRILYKDMFVATELGRELGTPMPIANLALADLQVAMGRGWQDRDCRSMMLIQQERAGVHFAVDPADIAEVFRRDPPAPTDATYGK
jgi:3-hydroxyisobutyrate dehydrogenase-like beta-hydroxyacid dehydrogenase